MAGAWHRSVILLGDSGCLRITDSGSQWLGGEGEPIESDPHAEPMTAGELIAKRMKQIIERPAPAAEAPADALRILAMCEAARISARTGDGETPQKVLEALRKPYQ